MAALLLLKLALHLHLLLQAVDKFNLLTESILIIVALSLLLLTELAIATILLLLDLFALSGQLFLLALAK